MPENFSFLMDGLAGSARPGRYEPLVSDLHKVAAQGITAIVSLTETPLEKSAVQETGFQHRHIPVIDFQPPSVSQMDEFVSFVDKVRAEGGKVLVHCAAGVGRTGTMLAAYLVHQGKSALDAIDEVRTRRPGSVETQGQINAVLEFEKIRYGSR